MSEAQPPPAIVRTDCVPTVAPTVFSTSITSIFPSTSPSPVPTSASTAESDCITITISMTDSWGDGWNDNYLYFDEPENMAVTPFKVTLLGGHSGSATLCLPPGTYSPFACGGTLAS